MVDSVAKALMLDKIQIDGKTILIVQHNQGGSPFLHSLLTQSARQGRKICLVSFNQTADYYHNIGTRLGWNLNSLLAKKQVVFIGGLQTLKETMRLQDSTNPFEFVSKPSLWPLEALLSSIKDTISHWGDQPFSLVIDELDCLFSLGIVLKDVICLFQNCHSSIQKAPKGSLVVSVGVVPTDNEMIQCSSLLSHWSDLVLTEKGLQTGKSKDLTGILRVNWNIPPVSEQHFHFKCFDRGIRIFAPGTAVL